jgi:hypothetical protein
MISSEILAAYSDECRDLTAGEMASLSKPAIPQSALDFDRDRRWFRVRAATVVFLDGNRFEFARCFRGEGTEVIAAIIVCQNELGDVVDLCAWDWRRDVTALWLGRVGLLGEDIALAPRVGDTALRVFPSVAQWLIGERFGVVVLEPNRARNTLVAASPLVVGTLDFGRWLRDALAAPLPRILIEEFVEGVPA